jgi:serpin B
MAMRVGRSGGRALVAAVGLVWLVTAGACTTPGSTVVASGTEARSATARMAVPAGEAGAAATAVGSLGASLYKGIAAGKRGENIVFSPLSIEAALAMVRNGAMAETRAEMDRVLGAGSGEVLDRSLNALDAALAAHDGPIDLGILGKGEIGLRTSNALWAQQGFVLYAAFLDVLARHYGAGVNVVDFAGATEAARARINAYVSEKTNGKIPALLAPGTLPGDTRFVLTNTIWFKAPWAYKLTARGDLPFHRADGSVVSVPTMAGLPAFGMFPNGRYGSGPGWQAAELPYLGQKLSMVVIVPDDLAAFEAGLDGPGLAAVTGGLQGDLHSIQLPRWTTRTAVDLPDQLAALGMRRAFTDAAQFGALSPESTMIDDVVHQAFIAVDEDGTEAAAATAVIGAPTAFPPPRGTSLVVDKPFLYAIRDIATGAILFLGRVADPSVKDS